MEYVVKYFSKICELSNDSIILLLSCIDKVEIKKNTVIIKEGKTHPYIYIIEKGLVRGYTTDDFIEDTNTFWMESETFGDVKSFISDIAVSKSYQAVEDLLVYRVDKFKFRGIFTENIELATLGRKILENYILRSEYRVTLLKISDLIIRYRTFCEMRKGLNNRIKLKNLASYLKITPETLSRIRSSHI